MGLLCSEQRVLQTFLTNLLKEVFNSGLIIKIIQEINPKAKSQTKHNNFSGSVLLP